MSGDDLARVIEEGRKIFQQWFDSQIKYVGDERANDEMATWIMAHLGSVLDAASRAESTAARLAEADAVIGWTTYAPGWDEYEYNDLVKWQDESKARYAAARASRARKGETR